MVSETREERRARKARKARRVAALVTPVLKLLALTIRIQKSGEEGLRAHQESGVGLLGIYFHGVTLPMVFGNREWDVRVLISQHGDGELIAEAARRFGYGAIRGSTSRGGSQALREMQRLDKQIPLIITPDGPRGPAKSIQQGCVLMASSTGRPVIPVGVACSRAWRARSWDRFMVPKPFSRIAIHYGPGLFIDADLPRERIPEETERIRLAMLESEKKAHEALGIAWKSPSNECPDEAEASS